MGYPDDRRYTKSHEWARHGDDGIVYVGITDHAQDALGEIVHVELPQVGRSVAAGKPCAEVESVKSASDIYSPVSGKVVAVNDALKNAPELVNASAHDDAWMFGVLPSDMQELAQLLDAAAYEAVLANS